MDDAARKKALRMIPYGLYVVTSGKGEDAVGFTATWLSQASFDPPLVMLAVRRDSRSLPSMVTHGAFAVNFLGNSQKDLADAFFRGPVPEDGKFGDYAFQEGETGCAVLDDAPAAVECEVTDTVERGDHTVVIGQVVRAIHRTDDAGLELRATGWQYGG